MEERDKRLTKSYLEGAWLKSLITREQADKLFSIYSNSPRRYEGDVKEDLKKIYSAPNPSKYVESLMLIDKLSVNKEKVQEAKKADSSKPKLSLENIEEFSREPNNNDGIKIIKVHYPYPDDRIEMVEKGPSMANYTIKEIFESLQAAYGENGMVSSDIFDAVFKESCRNIECDKIEKYLNNQSNLMLTQKQIAQINYVASNPKLKDKKIVAAPEEDIFIIYDPNTNNKDAIVRVSEVYENGIKRYKLEVIKSNGYDYEKDFKEMSENSLDDGASYDVGENAEKEREAELERGYSKKIDRKRTLQDRKNSGKISELYFIIVLGIIFALILFLIFSK